MDQPPQYQPPPADPALAILQQQAQGQSQGALQTQAGLDTAKIAMLYGQMASLGISPQTGGISLSPHGGGIGGGFALHGSA